MAKGKREIQARATQDRNGVGQQIHHVETFDDNLLPDAEEIRALQACDPNILEWLKKTAEKEQAFRHEAFAKRLELTKSISSSRSFRLSMGMIFAFLLMLVGMGCSTFLIYFGHQLVGSLFAGTSLFGAISIFVQKDKKEEPASQPSQQS